MVPLAYVDRVYSEKLRKLQHETKMAKKSIKKMHNRMIDSQSSQQKQISALLQENLQLKQRLSENKRDAEYLESMQEYQLGLYSSEVDDSRERIKDDFDQVPDDEGISELSQTFLIEQTKMHITERTNEDSFAEDP